MAELEESDYTPEQVEAWATQAAEEFIEQMDETYVFLSDQITGYEIALRVIQKELERLKGHTRGDWVEAVKACPYPMDDLLPRSRELPKDLELD